MAQTSCGCPTREVSSRVGFGTVGYTLLRAPEFKRDYGRVPCNSGTRPTCERTHKWGTRKHSPREVHLGHPPQAPVGKDCNPVELHHDSQKPSGPFQEMTRTEHRGAGNFNKNHPRRNRPSRIDRAEAGRQRREYWKRQAEIQKKKKKSDD